MIAYLPGFPFRPHYPLNWAGISCGHRGEVIAHAAVSVFARSAAFVWALRVATSVTRGASRKWSQMAKRVYGVAAEVSAKLADTS
jgi:DNA-binding IclR family transcriptional regulator